MSAIVRFPPRQIAAVVICRERDGGGWLTIARGHGWLHGSLAEAITDAVWLAKNLALPIQEARP